MTALIRKLLGFFALKTVFKEDPFFRSTVTHDSDHGRVRITVDLLGSKREWVGRFRIRENQEFPLQVSVPDEHVNHNEFYELSNPITSENRIVLELETSPLSEGMSAVEFWFETKVGVGGTISVVPVSFGLGDSDQIKRNELYREKLYARWVDENRNNAKSRDE